MNNLKYQIGDVVTNGEEVFEIVACNDKYTKTRSVFLKVLVGGHAYLKHDDQLEDGYPFDIRFVNDMELDEKYMRKKQFESEMQDIINEK